MLSCAVVLFCLCLLFLPVLFVRFSLFLLLFFVFVVDLFVGSFVVFSGGSFVGFFGGSFVGSLVGSLVGSVVVLSLVLLLFSRWFCRCSFVGSVVVISLFFRWFFRWFFYCSFVFRFSAALCVVGSLVSLHDLSSRCDRVVVFRALWSSLVVCRSSYAIKMRCAYLRRISMGLDELVCGLSVISNWGA